ncbi:MAG: hypothetical protein A2W93_01290 [Bacteroidetes bacterium GWF2_43_63]|nr:MAG: hypothetical protein A2W94_10780 [Bacteroidetes bacterium GWE2_42_42]OFY55712.1 MAG: hypothetical protein A2W93_01290 [Bacteroidetes bacterium GWF2_43_63]HBG69481.1 hypothetical protein [Bacteroidales bacterium]HCB61352.1 hypothetical protein [Bacteroidales bacterium]HCY24227.1 hypothetical protein [Bacteroidales bacterium]
MKFFNRILYLTTTLALFSCSNGDFTYTETRKMSADDPFQNTIAPSQFFEIDNRRDTVLEGEQGTIMILPKGCFVNSEGEPVSGNIRIELAEAYSPDDMLGSNLTTTSDGNPLITDGMIFFNATVSGKQLGIRNENPVHIEMPTPDKKPGMMVYEGVRDDSGKVNWVKPKAPDNFMKTVDIFSLDFLPEGFQRQAESMMDFRDFSKVTTGYFYHVYFNLSDEDGSTIFWDIIKKRFAISTIDVESNEKVFDQQGSNITNNNIGQKDTTLEQVDTCAKDTPATRECGIDPSRIKAIRNKHYQNTLIATKEFETRLKTIFKTCDNEILDIYVENLNKNMYELDSLAMEKCIRKGYTEQIAVFRSYFGQRLTKVKSADKYAKMLNGYYSDQLKKIKAELKIKKQKVIEAMKKENENSQKIVADYQKLLSKREKQRMETYGFNLTKTGWINIDNGTEPKEWNTEYLKVIVKNGKEFDRTYAYVWFSTMGSLSRLNTQDQEIFHAGNFGENTMLMPSNKQSTFISIGYKGENPSLFIRTFETGKDTMFYVVLQPTTPDELKKVLSPFDGNSRENSIVKDLEFMQKFFEEKKEINMKIEKEMRLLSLWNIAFPCCAIDLKSLQYYY